MDEDLWPVEQPDPVEPCVRAPRRVTMNIDLFESNSVFKGRCVSRSSPSSSVDTRLESSGIEAEIVAQAAGIVFKRVRPLMRRWQDGSCAVLANTSATGQRTWKVLLPMMTAMANHHPLQRAPGRYASERGASAPANTVDALQVTDNKGIVPALPQQDADKWQVALNRFRELTGTDDISISRKMVKSFLEDMAQLPSRFKKGGGDAGGTGMNLRRSRRSWKR